MHGDETALHAIELTSELIFAWIDNHLRLAAEQIVFHLDKPVEVALLDVVRIDLVDLSLIVEEHLVDVLRAVSHNFSLPSNIKNIA